MEDQDEYLRRRAIRVIGDRPVSDVIAKVRAIIGPANIPDSEAFAQAALSKLREGVRPTPAELSALEIVIRLLRPVVMSSENGVLGDLPDNRADTNESGRNLYPEELKDAWASFRINVRPYMRSIGRIETNVDPRRHIGTGFLVRDGLLATNRHVLAQLAYGADALEAGAARVVFRQEAGAFNEPHDIVVIEGVAAVHRVFDMVLLRIPKTGRLGLVLSTSSIPETESVATIGYPGEDKANNPLFLSAVFGGHFGFRAASLGEVMDGSQPPVLQHDCSTTQGNSGSPVFSLKTTKVAGIHRSGLFMYRNEAVDVQELRRFVDSFAE